jgi:hypothetical protein
MLSFGTLVLGGQVPSDALIVFIDDDDWLAPQLFARLRELAPAAADVDGFKWGSVLMGRSLHPSLDADASFALHPTLLLRPIQLRIATNNYAVSGAALRRLDIDTLFEHFHAQGEFESGRFAPDTVAQYLSCANKHPASSVSAFHLWGSEDFRRDPRADIERWAESVMSVRLPVDLAWMAAPRQQLAALLADTVGSR